jgi:ABC-type nickel/cobalt efflux system permease component RcnA
VLAVAAVAAVVAAGGALTGAPAASAHPLGNFSINHLVRVGVSAHEVDLHYILDQAEIPTFQERDLTSAQVLSRKRAEVMRRLSLRVNGVPVPLTVSGPGVLTHPPGQGGLALTRVELSLTARVIRPRQVTVYDGTFPDRIGWKAIVASPGRGTDVTSSVPSGDPTHGLRYYPQSMLSSPVNERTAQLSVRPGNGSLVAPTAPGGRDVTTNRAGDNFAQVFADAAAGRGVLVFLLLAAFAWGALHALSPGHGKTMVAAYLVGTRGTTRHALALGATVTITHTIGVFSLGLVTLLLSHYVLPEQLYPWLNLASGLLVLVIGAGVLRSRARRYLARRAERPMAHASHEHVSHAHHSHEHGSDVHGAGAHEHHHQVPDDLSWRGLIAMGASAGLIPCPSALVVLLGAIAQRQVPLGLVMIAVFSLGLATTLSLLGILVVHAKALMARAPISARAATALPAVSAAVIVGAGCLLTLRAVPGVVG